MLVSWAFWALIGALFGALLLRTEDAQFRFFLAGILYHKDGDENEAADILRSHKSAVHAWSLVGGFALAFAGMTLVSQSSKVAWPLIAVGGAMSFFGLGGRVFSFLKSYRDIVEN